MIKNLVIVESPAKAKTIEKFLGPDYKVMSSYGHIRDLKKKDIAMVYISHRMDEIKVITDRVTVMRDGTYVGTLITEECTKEDIINMMVGRVIMRIRDRKRGSEGRAGCIKGRTPECGQDGTGCQL